MNSTILTGRLAKEVELRKTANGVSQCNFVIAVNDGYGEHKKAHFINCVAWRQTADFLSSYAKKGNLVGVEGRLQTRTYDDKDGKRVYVTEVVCDNVQLLESRQVREGYDSNRTPSYTSAPANPSSQSIEPKNSFDDLGTDDSFEISSDDLPF